MKWGKTLKKTGLVVLSLLVLAVILAYMSGAFHEKIPPGKTESAKRVLKGEPTDVVHKIVQTERLEVVGTLRAERRTEISSRLMAAIVEMNVRAGDRVEKGAVLIRLDDRDLRARLDQAKQGQVAARAMLEQARQGKLVAEADLEKVRKDYERFKNLLEQKVASQQEFDQSEKTFKIAQASLEKARQGELAAEAGLEETGKAIVYANALLSHSVIEAPVGGKVIDKLADVGDVASPGKPLLVIYDPSALRLEAAVPEALASGMSTGDPLDVIIDTLETESPLSGEVDEIVPQAEAATRSVLVKVRVPRVEGMVEGLFGRLLIPSRERERLCLAQSAVREVGQLRFVDVVGEGGALERRQVRLGEHSRLGRIEVLSGLDADETVVLYGPPPEPLPPGVKLFGAGEER